MKKTTLVLLVILFSLAAMGQNTNARAGWGDTVTHAPDTVLAPSGYLFWDLTVAARDSALEVSFTGTFPAADKFTLDVNSGVAESYEWKDLPVSKIPKAYIRKKSGYAGAANYKAIRGGK